MLGNVIAGDDCNRSADLVYGFFVDDTPLAQSIDVRRYKAERRHLPADARFDAIKRGSMQQKTQMAFIFFCSAAMDNQRRKPRAQPQAIWRNCVPLAVPIRSRSLAIRTSTVAIATRSKCDVWCRKATSVAR